MRRYDDCILHLTLKHRLWRKGVYMKKRGSFFIALVATVFSSLAYAGDAKTYPGSMCQQIYWWQGIPTYWYSAIGNPLRGGSLTVNCPVTKDTVDRQYKTRAWVKVIDRNVKADVKCKFCSAVWYEYPWSFVTETPWVEIDCPEAITSHGSKKEVQNLLFLEWPSISGLGEESYYFFSCEIPPKDEGISYISTYHVNELGI